MTHDGCIERLSDHLDGTLPPAEARAVRDHLARCAECAGVLAELRALVGRAAALPDRPPERDLWPDIAAALEGPGRGSARSTARRPRRLSLSIPQLAAAGLALAFASGLTAWWVRPLATDPAVPAASAAGPAFPGAAPVATLPQERAWSAEVAELERALASAGDLDPATVRTLERNLTIIDRAIRESREALASDPGNPFLEEHLARAWSRKVATLREAAALAGWLRS